MRKVMFWSPCIYLFTCMRVTRISQKVLNRIAWNLVGWLVIIGDHLIRFWDRSGQSHEKVKIFLNRMKFGGMIGYYPGTIWLDVGINRVKGQGQGQDHEKVKIFFLP